MADKKKPINVQQFFDRFMKLLKDKKAEDYDEKFLSEVISRYADIWTLITTGMCKVDDDRIWLVNRRIGEAVGREGRTMIKQAARQTYERDIGRTVNAHIFAEHETLKDLAAENPVAHANFMESRKFFQDTLMKLHLTPTEDYRQKP